MSGESHRGCRHVIDRLPAGSPRRAGTILFAALAVAGLAQCGMEPESEKADVPRACGDGADNDGDGVVDYPYDPGCEAAEDPSEADPATPRACSDGIDNDQDGRIDYDFDHNQRRDGNEEPGCQSAADDDETNVAMPSCGDGIDNDSDGAVDLADSGCANRNDDSEAQ